MRDLTVADVMHAGIYTLHPDASVTTLAGLMAERSIHSVVVDGVQAGPRGERLVWGLVTDMDLLGAVHAGAELDAGTLAATEIQTVSPDQRLTEAVTIMVEHDLSHVVVVGDDGRPLGVLSSLDVARAVAGEPLAR